MYCMDSDTLANSKLIIQLFIQRKELHKLKLSHVAEIRRKYEKLYMLHKILRVKLHCPKLSKEKKQVILTKAYNYVISVRNFRNKYEIN
jgi:hypothetical protein